MALPPHIGGETGALYLIFGRWDSPFVRGTRPFARGAVELSPGTATGMAVGTEVAQPEPAAIATARMGTEVL